MSQALRKDFKPDIPVRDAKGVEPRPANGDHKNQVACAFARVGTRYEQALKQLAKI